MDHEGTINSLTRNAEKDLTLFHLPVFLSTDSTLGKCVQLEKLMSVDEQIKLKNYKISYTEANRKFVIHSDLLSRYQR